ncbi:hypothetical protein IW140_003549 [Coemansia sp. RSA 1813]|nr:hypothetical protein EV178_003484 [Coemansia sp. RSA 1646]KAJ1769154.1 hypothetical protein LPJ74_004270 [Coemansia sp. RSA 1843]KAJ2089141.1 hypothetical protein IW138_003721 [Coemansia sp. RSA 986]KAJ2215602.1 hypothetical protein EV179_002013 [Coemansia sp. RSA 487]KAJ2568792.1 hypothetical protein IW140_003549 [Coemansia sp. RSA 1813]
MDASAGERKKQDVLGSMASDSQAASSPELASQFVSEILQFDDRPRSWSACSDVSVGSQGSSTPRNIRKSATFSAAAKKGIPRSLRPASILSSARSSIGATSGDAVDCLTTGSQPSIATTFSSDSHQVEARGRIYAQPKSTQSSTIAKIAYSPRKPTLAMMKPLAALNKPDSQSDILTSKDECTGDTRPFLSRRPSSRTRRDTTPATCVAQISVESSPARPSEEKPSSNKKTYKRPSSMYMWSAFSRLSSSGSASDGDVAGPAKDTRKPAIDHLKTIETKKGQAEEDAHNEGGESSIPDDANESSNVDIHSSSHEAKHEDKKIDDSRWAWGWFGGQSSSKPPSKANDVAPPPEHAAASMEQEAGAKPAAPEEQRVYSKDHNTRQKDNMLLPDLIFGETAPGPNSLHMHEADTTTDASSNSIRSAESSDTATSLKKGAADMPDRGPERPIYKRLRTLGMAAIGSAIEMAPGWARSMLYGQSAADALGQQGNTDSLGDRTRQTAESIKESIDKGAKRLGRVAIIGIHGWFPTRMVQMLSGEPTGKSEKFCLMMRDALQTYLLESHGVNIDDSQVSLFPLVGEGKIDDRVELLLSQIIDSTEPNTSGLAAIPKEGEPATRSSSRAESIDTTASLDSSKPKPKTSATADSKHSEMMAKILMPEKSKRVDVLKEADTVFVVTHSQGTPVSAMILERLIELEVIDTTRQRVAMLAMAGISHGPLPHLKDNVVIKYIESEAARELFELMDPSSPQSQRYVAALSTILHKGVRLVCIGSWVDEVVPMYSAILQGVSHQNVYRAVYIDAPHYLDDFLTNLIVFALQLRNMGIYDHDLLIHLSEVVAGTLWGHSGHSTIYGEPSVYKLAIRWLLYSTSPAATAAHTSTSVPTAFLGTSAAGERLNGKCTNASGPRIHMSYRPFNASEKLNPFFIPWIMRTLWDEPEIRQNEILRTELRRLVSLFDQWAPDTKAGKELKYRLEPVRAAM